MSVMGIPERHWLIETDLTWSALCIAVEREDGPENRGVAEYDCSHEASQLNSTSREGRANPEV